MNKIASFSRELEAVSPDYIDPKIARANVLKMIKEIKADRERFAELKAQLQGKGDDERADALVKFINNNKDLVTALPTGDREVGVTITVTVTVTVLIFISSAY